MKKVLGIMLLTVSSFFIVGCGLTDTTTAPLSGTDVITFEVYRENGVLAATATTGYSVEDTLLSLLSGIFVVYCAGEDGEPDDTCTYEGSFGVYLVGIAGVMADDANEYIAFYVDGEYAVTGIGATALVGGSVYAFKLETF